MRAFLTRKLSQLSSIGSETELKNVDNSVPVSSPSDDPIALQPVKEDNNTTDESNVNSKIAPSSPKISSKVSTNKDRIEENQKNNWPTSSIKEGKKYQSKDDIDARYI